uniref:Uncharacterized protein n=1 Tax=Zea mays TaxID=4577 RepID=B6TK47_MAIZE|nr:hypothetical protein [Zea mays]
MAKLVNKLVDSFDHDEAPAPDVGCVRAVLAELVLTFLFVFTGVSASMAAGSGGKPGRLCRWRRWRRWLSRTRWPLAGGVV